jgi:hypothetical protein
MFNRLYEVTANKDYQERIRQTAQENCAARVEQANRTQTSILIHFGDILVHLGFHVQQRPHQSVNGVVVPR